MFTIVIILVWQASMLTRVNSKVQLRNAISFVSIKVLTIHPED